MVSMVNLVNLVIVVGLIIMWPFKDSSMLKKGKNKKNEPI
jgi:hypothetical protein